LDAILEQREDDIQFVLPGYSVFLDDASDVDRIETASDLVFANFFATLGERLSDPSKKFGQAGISLVAREANALTAVQEGRFELSGLWPAIRVTLIDGTTRWSFGERPPKDAFSENRFLLDLTSPCFGDHTTLLAGLLWDDKAKQAVQLNVATVARPGWARPPMTPVSWPLSRWYLAFATVLILMVGYFLRGPERARVRQTRSWEHPLAVLVAAATGPFASIAALGAIQPLLPPPFDPFITGIRDPILALGGVLLLPALGFGAVGLKVLDFGPLKRLRVDLWAHHALIPGVPVGTAMAGVWLLDRTFGYGLFLQDLDSALWILLPIAALIAVSPAAFLVETFGSGGGTGNRKERAFSIGGLVLLAALPILVVKGLALGFAVTAALALPGFLVLMPTVGSRRSKDREQAEASEEVEFLDDKKWIKGLTGRDPRILAARINPKDNDRGSSRVHVIRGPQGCGKTRLVDEAVRLIEKGDGGAPVRVLSCHARDVGNDEMATTKALLQPIGKKAVQTAIKSQERLAALQSSAGGDVSAILRLVPTIGPVLGMLEAMEPEDIEESEDKGPGEVRRALLNLLGAEVRRGTNYGPYGGLLVVAEGDDSDQLDLASRQFLTELVLEWPRLFSDLPPLSLVIVGAGPSDDRECWTTEMQFGESSDNLVAVDPLSKPEEVELLCEFYGFPDPEPAAMTKLIEVSKGSLEHILEWLVFLHGHDEDEQTPRLTSDLLNRRSLPPGLRSRIAREWRDLGLNEIDSWMVECAARLGTRFQLDDLAELLRQPPLQVAHRLARFERDDDDIEEKTELFRDLTDEDGGFVFTQPSIQRYLGEPRRDAVQQQTREFERRISGVLWKRLVEREEFAPNGELPTTNEAARHRDAIFRLRQSLEVSCGGSGSARGVLPTRLPWIRACAGLAALGSHSFDTARELMLEALGVERTVNDEKQEIAALSGKRPLEGRSQRDVLFRELVRILLALDDEDFCCRLVELWRSELDQGEASTEQQVGCLLNGSLARGRAGDYGTAQIWAQDALKIARPESLNHLEALFLSSWSRNPRDQEQRGLARQEATSVIDALKLLTGDAGTAEPELPPGDLRRARKLLGKAYNVRAGFQPEFDDRREDYSASISIKEEINDLDGLAYSYGGMGMLYYYKRDCAVSDLEHAKIWFEKDLEIVEETGDLGACTSLRSQLADILWRLGDAESGARYYKQSVDLAVRTGNVVNLAFACIGWATHLFRTGVPKRALERLEQALGDGGFKNWNGQKDRGWRYTDGKWSNGSSASFSGAGPWILLWGALQDRWERESQEGAPWDEPSWPAEFSDEVGRLRDQMAAGG